MPHTFFYTTFKDSEEKTKDLLTSAGIWGHPYTTKPFYSGTTISFSTKSNSWSSRYSFTPTCYMNVGNQLLSSNVSTQLLPGTWVNLTAENIAVFKRFGYSEDDRGWHVFPALFSDTPVGGYVEGMGEEFADGRIGDYVGIMYHRYNLGLVPSLQTSTEIGNFRRLTPYGGARIWRHDTNPVHNKFYAVDTQFTQKGDDSSIEVVVNDNSSATKIFKSLSLEANTSLWQGEVYTNDFRGEGIVEKGNENSQYNKAYVREQRGEFLRFIEKEGNQYSAVPRDIKNISPHNVKLIGKVRLKNIEHPQFGLPYLFQTAVDIDPYDENGEWTGSTASNWCSVGDTGEVFVSGPNAGDPVMGPIFCEYPAEYWDIPLFGPLLDNIPSTFGSQVFFGKTLVGITGEGTLYGAFEGSNDDGSNRQIYGGNGSPKFQGENGKELYGYAGGTLDDRHRAVDHFIPDVDKLGGRLSQTAGSFTTPTSNDGFHGSWLHPMRVVSYSRDGIKGGTEGEGVDVPPNSLRVQLASNKTTSLEEGDVYSIMATFNVNEKDEAARIAGLSEMKYHIQPEKLPGSGIGGASSYDHPAGVDAYILPNCEDVGLPPCSEGCYSQECSEELSEEVVNDAGWVGVYVALDHFVNGDPMRGPYMGIKLTTPGGRQPIELSAINVDYEKTKLDGSLG
tara:strand:- start:587 stop:2608 length:2022 start_codon:yes stop_codon:yes gene_type:complete